MLMMAKMAPLLVGGGEPPFEPTYLGFGSSASNSTEYVFYFNDLGLPADAGGMYLVGVAARDAINGRVNAVSINGSPGYVALTKIAENNQGFGHLQFWTTPTPLATSTGAALTVESSATLNCVGVHIWSVSGIESPEARDSTITTVDNGSLAFYVPAGAKTFGIASNNNTSASVTVSGATKVATETTIESSQLRSVAAMGTTSPMAFDWSSATNVRALAISLL
jgi:hypothetical protein